MKFRNPDNKMYLQMAIDGNFHLYEPEFGRLVAVLSPAKTELVKKYLIGSWVKWDEIEHLIEESELYGSQA